MEALRLVVLVLVAVPAPAWWCLDIRCLHMQTGLDPVHLAAHRRPKAQSLSKQYVITWIGYSICRTCRTCTTMKYDEYDKYFKYDTYSWHDQHVKYTEYANPYSIWTPSFRIWTPPFLYYQYYKYARNMQTIWTLLIFMSKNIKHEKNP